MPHTKEMHWKLLLKEQKEMGPTDIYKAVTTVLQEKRMSFWWCLQNVSKNECVHAVHTHTHTVSCKKVMSHLPPKEIEMLKY